VRTYKLVFYGFFDEGDLVNERAFKWEKILINNSSVPVLRGVVNNVTDFSHILTSVRSKNLVTILPNNPVVIPNVDVLPITNLPTAAFLNHIHSLMETLPGIASVSTLLRENDVSGGVIFSF
jgi:hypothetical protein